MESPYFNKSARLLSITRTIQSHHPFQQIPSPEVLHSESQVKESYSYGTFFNWMSDIYKHLLNFLSIEALDESPFIKTFFQAAQLRTHRAHNVFENFYGKALSEVDAMKQQTDNVFELRWRLLQEQSLYQTLTKPDTNREILQQELDALLSMSLIRLLRLYTLMLHEHPTHSAQFEPHLAKEMMSFLDSNENFSSVPTIAVFKAIYRLESTAHATDYVALRTTHQQHRERLAFIDDYMAMLHLGNYCTHQINIVGDESYFSEALQLIKFRVDAGTFNTNNLLYPDFVYSVRMAVAAQDFDYANSFMNDFKSSLPSDVGEDIWNFCQAVICIGKGRFDDALGLLSQVNLTQYIFNVQVRAYTIQCLFHQGLWEQTLAAADTFRHYLAKEAQLTGYYKLALKDFVRIIPKMVRGFTGATPLSNTKRNKLISEVSEMSSNVFNLRNWTTKRVAEIPLSNH